MTEQPGTQQGQRGPSAEEAHPALFDALNSLIWRLHQCIDIVGIPEDHTAFGVVTEALIIRSFNQYRAIVDLLKTSHWEDALILTRSLFELLLNVEEILMHKTDLQEASARFLAFSQLQEYLHKQAEMVYHANTGRLPVETVDRITQIDVEAKKQLRVFRVVKKRREEWSESWCNKKVWRLSQDSENSLRPYQYRILYSWASQFAHGSPRGVLSAVHLTDKPLDQKAFVKLHENREEKMLREVAGYATTFILFRSNTRGLPRLARPIGPGCPAACCGVVHSGNILLPSKPVA